jgi:hypothetical protein
MTYGKTLIGFVDPKKVAAEFSFFLLVSSSNFVHRELRSINFSVAHFYFPRLKSTFDPAIILHPPNVILVPQPDEMHVQHGPLATRPRFMSLTQSYNEGMFARAVHDDFSDDDSLPSIDNLQKVVSRIRSTLNVMVVWQGVARHALPFYVLRAATRRAGSLRPFSTP